jgi:hypothetical protein
MVAAHAATAVGRGERRQGRRLMRAAISQSLAATAVASTASGTGSPLALAPASLAGAFGRVCSLHISHHQGPYSGRIAPACALQDPGPRVSCA